jgi:hypothetical protein
MAKEKTDLAGLTREDREGKLVLAVENLPDDLKTRVSQLYGEIGKATTEFLVASIKIGSIIDTARQELSQRGDKVFVAFLNGIPGMAQATAYRYMNSYAIAKERFPEPVLKMVLAGQLAMIGSKQLPYGKYTEIIQGKALERDLRNIKTNEAAAEWIEKVDVAWKKTHGKGKGPKLGDPTTLQQEAFRVVLVKWNKLPKRQRTVNWMSQLVGYVFCAMGVIEMPSVRIPRELPKDFVNPIKPEKEEDTEEKASAASA